MSTDKVVTENLVQVLQDGKDGYQHAADLLSEAGSTDLAAKFNRNSAQRGKFAADLEQMAAAYGDDVDESGTVKATAHRVWMSLKDKLTGSDVEAIVGAALQGEEYAVSQFEEALNEDISPKLHATIQRQLSEIKLAQSELHRLNTAA